jgi:hypothetical protein
MIIDFLRQEHRNIEKLLLVLEQELSVFDRGERPDYEVIRAVIAYFEVYPDVYHHPQEDMDSGRVSRISRSISSRLPLSSVASTESPVAFPPGRARDWPRARFRPGHPHPRKRLGSSSSRSWRPARAAW